MRARGSCLIVSYYPVCTSYQVGTSDLPAVQVVLAADEMRLKLTNRLKILQARIDAGEEEDSLIQELDKVMAALALFCFGSRRAISGAH